MSEWLIFCLFAAVGLSLIISGIIYMNKEKGDSQSVKLYRFISIIGACLLIIAIISKFVL